MRIINKSYRTDGPLNKLVVSLNNAMKSAPIKQVINATGRSPHVLVDEDGYVEILSDPRQAAVVPFAGTNLLSPHDESPAVWVEFTGTGPGDLKGMDVAAILNDLCEYFDVPFDYPTVADGLCGEAFTKTSGIIQRKSLLGHSNATKLPLPKISRRTFDAIEPVDLTPDTEDSAVEEAEVGVQVEEVTIEWPESTGRPIKFGSKSTKIALIAEAYGLDSVEYDEDIQSLVISMQEEAGLEPNGIIDAATWAALDPNK